MRGGDKGREGEGGMARGRTPGRKRKRERERGGKREGGTSCQHVQPGLAGTCWHLSGKEPTRGWAGWALTVALACQAEELT